MNAKVRFALLFACDQLISAVWVAPLVVLFWRGIWDLLDAHFIPEHPAASAWSTLVEHFKRWQIVQYSVAWILLCHFYSYIGAVLSVCHWRGVWEVLDIYTGTGPAGYAVSLVVGQVILWLLRSSKCASAPPQILFADIGRDIFETPSRFGFQLDNNRMAYIGDHVFTSVVPSTAAVCVWRGFWGLADLYFHPESFKESAMLSLIIGYCVYALCMPLQACCNLLFREMIKLRSPTLSRIILEDFIILIGNFGAIHVWRGVRMGLNLVLLPNNVNASLLVGHFCSFILLSFTLTSDSVQARGFSLTGALSKEGCLFENQFLRMFFSAPSDPQYSSVRQAEHETRPKLSRKIVKYRNAIVKLSLDEEDDRQGLVPAESSEA
ncbi:hypothetical protein CAPTEDRAFT_205595 [Capitella teleta]|uniref:Uncharacterized protein n=1 Tax=Capitella teleta TaxID=283909 RepID=R7U5Q6_CAPTE|nr:hypothetical protein CAPTEDRAFT_205595 [Capitella teleta]|eukprot:ELT98480.1 hypothetical protein CAPTEDRAFT_205595 [Capitella teleta]